MDEEDDNVRPNKYLVSWYLSHAYILESAINLHFDFNLQYFSLYTQYKIALWGLGT